MAGSNFLNVKKCHLHIDFQRSGHTLKTINDQEPTVEDVSDYYDNYYQNDDSQKLNSTFDACNRERQSFQQQVAKLEKEVSSLKGQLKKLKSLENCTTQATKETRFRSLPCVFPFKFGGTLYRTCYKPKKLGNRHLGQWCATSVRTGGAMSTYGFCKSSCPLEPAEFPESLVSDSKLRVSRPKTRLGLGLGLVIHG